MKKAVLLARALLLLSMTAAFPGSAGADPDPELSAMRAGVLMHDRAFFHERHEKGRDYNVEVLFPSPDWALFKAVRSPRPHFGVNINDSGETSQLYGGFTWEWRPLGDAFVDGTLGLSLHDGDLQPGRRGLEGLGLRVLFRESVEVGYRIRGRHGISFLLEHVSNAGLAHENQGITSMGLRYGYRF